MKNLIAGVGLTVLAIPSTEAVAASFFAVEAQRAKHANLSKPIVRVKRSRTEIVSCGHCQPAVQHYRPPPATQCQPQAHTGQCQLNSLKKYHNRAQGWQRGAKVTPNAMAQKPKHERMVQMHAFYAPEQQVHTQQRVHRISGPIRNPACRYIG